MEELNRPDLESYKKAKKLPLICVLDNVRSAHNAGSILRTCDGFGIQEAWLCGFTAGPENREFRKTALGAEKSVTIQRFDQISDAIEMAKMLNTYISVIEQTTNAEFLMEATWDAQRTHLLIFGNEVDGVSQEWLLAADRAIEIQQAGTKHSLNVSVCAGIAIFSASISLKG